MSCLFSFPVCSYCCTFIISWESPIHHCYHSRHVLQIHCDGQTDIHVTTIFFFSWNLRRLIFLAKSPQRQKIVYKNPILVSCFFLALAIQNLYCSNWDSNTIKWLSWGFTNMLQWNSNSAANLENAAFCQDPWPLVTLIWGWFQKCISCE